MFSQQRNAALDLWNKNIFKVITFITVIWVVAVINISQAFPANPVVSLLTWEVPMGSFNTFFVDSDVAVCTTHEAFFLAIVVTNVAFLHPVR